MGLPRLLYISPTYPARTGNGLAMRAGTFLEVLNREYRVSLLVVPLFGGSGFPSANLIERCCEQYAVLPPPLESGTLEGLRERFDGLPDLMRLAARRAKQGVDVFDDTRFDVIHAFRLYTAPLAVSLADRDRSGRPPRLHLDLDDIESVTCGRIAQLYEMNGLTEEAQVEAAEAKRYEAAEKRFLPRFDRVYVASEADAQRVRPQVRTELRVAPNTVSPPAEPVSALTTHPFTFLFVGSHGYYPNEDAVLYFCREVLPKLRAQAERPFLVRIVGTGLPGSLRQIGHLPEVRLIGEVPDVTREYADAEAVIMPLRAGGGTRIKALEAFAYRRPVITTSIGVEGIEVTPDVHCLIGDSSGDFARCCLRVIADDALRLELTDAAYRLVTERYSPAVLEAATAPSPSPQLRPAPR